MDELSFQQNIGFEAVNYDVIQSEVKSILKGKIFIGQYISKQRCDTLQSYRDLIVVKSSAEPDLIKCLKKTISVLHENFGKHIQTNHIFVGISSVPNSLMSAEPEDYSIWTELGDGSSTLPFGKYWFSIKSVKFREREIQIRLKIVRPVADTDEKQTFTEKLKAATSQNSDGTKKSSKEGTDSEIEKWKALFNFWKREISEFVVWILSISINFHTIKEALRFISLLIVSLFAGSTTIVKYLGIFGIQLVEKTTWLIHACTPIALSIIDLFSKIVGGLFLLLAMIWRDTAGAPRRPPPNNAIEDRRYPQKRQAIGFEQYQYDK
ncbi:unnamed protein product [Diamesa serratosioi]